jgi:hypothetical protein
VDGRVDAVGERDAGGVGRLRFDKLTAGRFDKLTAGRFDKLTAGRFGGIFPLEGRDWRDF